MTGTRKDNGESWISTTKNDRGYYEARVWMGLRGNGKPDRRHVQRKSLKAVKERVRELERKRDLGRVPKAGKAPTVRQMMDRYLTVVLPQRGRAPTTIRAYRSHCLTDIYPRWGAQRIDRLQSDDIEDGLADMLSRGLSASTVRKVRAILSAALTDQVDREVITRNPCNVIKPTEVPDREAASLSQSEAKRLMAAAAESPNAARWALALAHGLRQGEALAPRWEGDLDLDAGLLRVRRQLQRLTWSHGCADRQRERLSAMDEDDRRKERARIEHACAAPHCKVKPCRKVKGRCRLHTRECPPPCPADCRDHARLCPDRKGGGLVFRDIKEKRRKQIRLAPQLVTMLRDHRDAQLIQKLTAGDAWEDCGLVFCRWNGRPLDPRRDYAEWLTILERAGLPRHKLHALRHSAATIALEKGVEITVVQEMLGHSDIRVTRRYSHPSEAQHGDAALRMGALLDGPEESG